MQVNVITLPLVITMSFRGGHGFWEVRILFRHVDWSITYVINELDKRDKRNFDRAAIAIIGSVKNLRLKICS